jgi:hypothetical protein
MVKGLLKESLEAYKAQLGTTEGWFAFLIGNLFWGWFVIKYNDLIFEKILSFITFIPGNLGTNIVAYTLFSLMFIPLDLLLLWILTNSFRMIGFTNKKVFKT